jgi:hypothetical protein
MIAIGVDVAAIGRSGETDGVMRIVGV